MPNKSTSPGTLPLHIRAKLGLAAEVDHQVYAQPCRFVTRFKHRVNQAAERRAVRQGEVFALGVVGRRHTARIQPGKARCQRGCVQASSIDNRCRLKFGALLLK